MGKAAIKESSSATQVLKDRDADRVRSVAPAFPVEVLPPGRIEDIPRLGSSPRPVMRLLDIILAAGGLIVFSPVMLVLAIMVRLETPGPILFRQKRLGKNGELFTLVKFRSFYADAKQRFPELYAYKYGDEELKTLIFKSADDPRITPMGRWLRKTSLDELPNLWNVLKGDMALVGPRPEIPEMIPYYRGEMLKRFSVKPGLTSLAHCSGRANLTFLDSISYDVDYVNKRSFALDIKIIWRTALAVLKRDGAF